MVEIRRAYIIEQVETIVGKIVIKADSGGERTKHTASRLINWSAGRTVAEPPNHGTASRGSNANSQTSCVTPPTVSISNLIVVSSPPNHFDKPSCQNLRGADGH